jgi:hypothetical protein
MLGRLLERLADRLFERHDITRRGAKYLTRWVVAGERYGPGRKLFLHLFHDSDPDGALHDHPWHFWSLVLGPGYWEWTDAGRRWKPPLSLLRRPALWRHRVEIPAGRRCWSLVWTSDKLRSWGFWCPRGFVGWRDYVGREEAGSAGCGEGS